MNRTLLMTLACLASVACTTHDGDETVGSLEVRVTTTGTPDPDGYTLSVDGQPDRTLTASDTTLYSGLPFGDYTVTLGDVEGGCTVTNGPTRAKYVAIGFNSLVYSVTCP